MKNYRLVFRVVDRDKFNEIIEGIKTIETRAATTKYQAIHKGDIVTFVCGGAEISKTVTRVEHFGTLDEMFSQLPLQRIMPSVKNIEAAKKVYQGFPNYMEKIAATGILAFHLE